MAVKLSLTPDCRLLTYHLTGISSENLNDADIAAGVVDLASVEVYSNGELAQSFEANLMNFEVDSVIPDLEVTANQYTINIGNDSNFDGGGIITMLMQDSGGNTASSAILSSCELDCCLAQKVLDLTNCTDCNPKCSDKLATAQKIFLYLESIRTMLSQLGNDVGINEGIISQALDTYNAAKDLCSDSCGCNC